MIMKKLHLLALFAVLFILCACIVFSASAATTMSITSHDNDDIISWDDSFKIRWNKVTGAVGYRVTIGIEKNGVVTEYLVNGKYTTSTYFTATSYLPETNCRLKIWVGAMESSTQEAVNAFTSEIIRVNLSHAPGVTISGSSSITANSAVLEMSVDRDYGYAIEDCGFYIGTSSSVSKMEQYSFWDYSTSNGATTKGTKYMTIPDLTPGTKYYYRAYAVNAAGEEYTSYKTFTTAKGSLAKPVITYPADRSTCYTGSDIKLQWNSVSGVDGYRYRIKQLSGSPNTSETDEPYVNMWEGTTSSTKRYYTLKASELVPGYWYKFVVEAYADDADSGWSAWHYVYVEKGSLEKAEVISPDNTASYPGYQSIKFAWEPVAGATAYNYHIKRLAGIPDRTNPNEPSLGEPWIGKTTSTSYTLSSSNVIPGSWYKFVVEATGENVNASWSEWVYCYIEEVKLERPEINTPTEWTEIHEGNSVVVDWDNVAGADGYRCHIKQLAGKPDTSSTNELAVYSIKKDCGTTSKYTLSGSKVHGGYWYKFVVESYSQSASSTWSEWVYVYVPENGTLERATISSPSTSKSYEWGEDIRFTWTKVPNATNYTYYVKQLKGEPAYSSNEPAINAWTGTTNASNRFFTLPGDKVLPDMWYKFVVEAEADGYDNSWSKYTYIYIPDREDWIHAVLTSGISTVSDEAFADNERLRTFDASESPLETIGERAFQNCVNLRSIFLPGTVFKIADNAFVNCPQLTIHCYKDSYAHQYAVKKNIPVVLHGVVEQTDMLQLSQTSWNINFAEAAQAVIRVNSSSKWTATSSSGWLTLSASSGSDGANVVFEAGENTGKTSRTATVTFTCGKASATVTVTQSSTSGKVCTMDLNHDYWEPSNSEMTREIVVKSETGFDVSSNKSWLTYTTKNASVIAKVASSALNTSQTGTLTVTCKECGAKKTVTVAIKQQVVPTPSSVKASSAEPHAVELAWKPVSGASYIIERSNDGKTGWTQVATADVGSKGYIDGDPNYIGPTTTYYYRVTACKVLNGSPVRSEPSAVVSATTIAARVVEFTGIVGSIGDNGRAPRSSLTTLSWNGLQDEDNPMTYKLTLKDTTTGKYVNGLQTANIGSGTSYPLSGLLTEGHTYQVWVGEYNKAGRHMGQTKVRTFTVISSNAPKPTITINSVSPASVNNSGNTCFGISFTATNASSFEFDFGALIVQEKWDKEGNENPKGPKSVWVFDGLDDIGVEYGYTYEHTEYTARFYPKASITPGTYTVTITANGYGGEMSVTTKITLTKIDTNKYTQNQDKIVAHAKAWLDTRFSAYGVHYYMKSAENKTVTDSTLYYHGMPYVGGGKKAKLVNGAWVQDAASGYVSHGIRGSLGSYQKLSVTERQMGVSDPYWYSKHATTSAYYGNECMGFVAQCWRAADNTVHSWVSLPNFNVDTYKLNHYKYSVTSSDDFKKAEPGDGLQVNGHIILVISNDISTSSIVAIEQTANGGNFVSCQCNNCKKDPSLRSLGTRQKTYSYDALIKEGYFAIIRLQECMSPDKTAGWQGKNLK